jgi:CheY-like chemotaxis protein
MRDNTRMAELGAVLIVEDSESAAAMMEMALAGIADVPLLTTPSALEALRILNGPGSPVCAVVTDLNMPRMDGFELIRHIREHATLSATPIIVVSADTDPSTPRRVAELGVDAFFPKPYSPAEVRRKLEQLLNAVAH